MYTVDEYFGQISVSLELSGSGCTALLEKDVREELSKSFNTRVRSWKGPAAGTSIMAQAIIEFYDNIPEDIKELLVKAVLHAIKVALKKVTERHAVITEIVLLDIDCDIRIHSFEGEELKLSDSERNTTLQNIRRFIALERARGNEIGQVDLPCELSDEGDRIVCYFGSGSSDLWYLRYKEHSAGAYFGCYDNANDCFIDDVILPYPYSA